MSSIGFITNTAAPVRAMFVVTTLLGTTWLGGCADPLPPLDPAVKQRLQAEKAAELTAKLSPPSSLETIESESTLTVQQRVTFLGQPLKGVRLVSALQEDEDSEDEDSEEQGDDAEAGQFDGEIDPSEIDLSEDAGIDVSASDWENAEMVPTPIPQKEIEAEEVPTPLGIPENRQRRRKPPLFQRPEGAIPVAPPTSMSPNGSPATKIAAVPAKSSDAAGSDPLSSQDPGIAGLPTGQGPVDYKSWEKPDVSLFVTGQQNGYIEPCGCTGLANQKGGVARRMAFMKQLQQAGWDLLPVDAGNLIRRFGRQAEIKLHRSLEALREMNYVAVGFGPDDVRIPVGDLLQEAAAESPEDAIYASANVVIFDPSLMPTHQLVSRNGIKVAVTSILDPDALKAKLTDEIVINEPIEAAKSVITEIQAKDVDYTVLTYYGKQEHAEELARQVQGIDLMVVAGGYGEPTYQPEPIENSATKMILTGNKGMYVGLVGLYKNKDFQYARVPLTDEFEDAPEMRDLMAEYQNQLRDLGFENLELDPKPHPSGFKFVGSKVCGDCHTTAYEIWESSPHFEATEHLVHPGERSDIPRHFDPECISCHVVGWDPQGFYPYESGYLELGGGDHLHGNGCEGCHGPGSAHVDVETGAVDATDERRAELRKAMELPLEKAQEKCMECHDLDNSPDFHEEGAFDEYWAEVEHYGVD